MGEYLRSRGHKVRYESEVNKKVKGRSVGALSERLG